VAKVIWGIIAIYFHQNTRPSDYEQFWVWIEQALPFFQDSCLTHVVLSEAKRVQVHETCDPYQPRPGNTRAITYPITPTKQPT
jgi:hypothetical protein